MLLLNQNPGGVIIERTSSLHFNMLLLNRDKEAWYQTNPSLFTFQYASIKPLLKLMHQSAENTFTFQYASIKPESTS